MFTKKLTISRVFERIDALRLEAVANGYCCFNYNDRFRYHGETTNKFRSSPFNPSLENKWSDELIFLSTMREKYGVDGENTLLVFEGVDHPDVNVVLGSIVGSRQASVDIKIKAHETDESQHAHFLFMGFEDATDMKQFIAEYGRKSTDKILGSSDMLTENHLLEGLDDWLV